MSIDACLFFSELTSVAWSYIHTSRVWEFNESTYYIEWDTGHHVFQKVFGKLQSIYIMEDNIMCLRRWLLLLLETKLLNRNTWQTSWNLNRWLRQLCCLLGGPLIMWSSVFSWNALNSLWENVPKWTYRPGSFCVLWL